MSLPFNEKLRQVCAERGSLLCVGLDPDPGKVPKHLDGDIVRFNQSLVEATSAYAAAFKLNAAFYEALGPSAWHVLRSTLDAIPSDIVTIYDAKRGDIGNSSRFYARSAFEQLGCDAITVNGYMGRDAVAPFIEQSERGAFVLCLTSNPGAEDFQYLNVNGRPLYESIALAARQWNKNSNCGLVVGATRPEALASLRGFVPKLPLLVPGVGVQGGDIASAVQVATDDTGFGAIFNVSRGILYASSGRDFAQAAADAARELRDQINQHRRA